VQGGGGGAGAAMLTAHPHHSTWVEVAGLCEDGLAFARGRRAGYRATSIVADREKRSRGASQSDNESVRKTTAARSKKEKTVKREKKEKKEKVERTEAKAGGDTEAASGGSVNLAPARTSPAVGTKAGDGGRWVHVPN
jgi:hypothetical protein